MSLMTSQILKSVELTKTQKSSCLKKETLFFLQIKKFINYTSTATLLQKIVLGGGNSYFWYYTSLLWNSFTKSAKNKNSTN